MEACSRISCPDYPWQATIPKIIAEMKYVVKALANSSDLFYHQVPKKFTSESIFMISILVTFMLIAAIGTAITIFENFCKLRTEGNHSRDVCKKRVISKNNIIARTYKDKESKEISSHEVRLKNFKNYLNCFCIATNGRKILSTSAKGEEFECLHGLRFVSNIWVIIIHVCALSSTTFFDLEELKLWTGHWVSSIVMNMSYSVDVFFVISGFLNGYFFSREYTKKTGKLSWFHFYLRRFIRISPVHMMVYWIYTTLFTYTGSGPLWPTYGTNPVCRKYWWWDFFYINNFLSVWYQCLIHNWYLSVNMQLYIMSPLFMVALLRRRRLGYILMALCICGSSFYNFAITVMYDLVDNELSFPYYVDNIELYLERFMHYHESIYLKPHTRMSSYFVGLTLGHYLWKRGISKEKSNSKITLFFGWIITAALLWICLYVFYFGEPTLLRRALYNGTSEFLFSCAVAWIIFVCVTGQGGFVNNLLSFGCFMPLSRLSYCAYLIHYPLILRYFLTSLEEGLAKWTFNLMCYISIHVTFWTYLLAFLTSLLIEVPVSRLFQCFLNKTVK